MIKTEEPSAVEQLVARLRLGGPNASEVSDEAADLIDALIKERDEARAAIAWANNSLYGSHGFFLSLNGGQPNEHHLDTAIEDLKLEANKNWAELTKLRAERDALIEESSFLLNRLDDLEHSDMSEETARDFHGHVSPSISRLRALIRNAIEAAEVPHD